MSTRTAAAIARRTANQTKESASMNNRAARRAAAKGKKPAPAKKVQKSKTLTFGFANPTVHKLRFNEVGDKPVVGGLYLRQDAAALFGFTKDGKLAKDGAQKTMTLRFTGERTTKGTLVFTENDHQDAIGSLYMRKDQALAILGISATKVQSLKLKVTIAPTTVNKGAGVKLTIEVI